MFSPETFVERVGDDALAPLAAAGDFACVGPDEPAAHGRIVAVRTDGPGSATQARRMAVESGRSVLCGRRTPAGWPDIEGTRASETMMRAVAVFVGRAWPRGAAPRHYRRSGTERPKAPPAACRRWGGCGSDGRREALRGKGC